MFQIYIPTWDGVIPNLAEILKSQNGTMQTCHIKNIPWNNMKHVQS